jgi:hypothetical protein
VPIYRGTSLRMPHWLSRALQRGTVTYSRADLVTVGLLGLLVSAWAALASQEASFATLLACEMAFFSFYLVGCLIVSWISDLRGLLFELPLRLLLGYAAVSSLLIPLAWLSPLGMAGNLTVINLGAAALVAAIKRKKTYTSSPASSWAVCLCAVATTLWCQDFLDPIETRGPVTIFKPWIDGFYHAVHIRIFAESHGMSTIEDFRMTGVPARLYHYGVYMVPAVIKQVSGMHSYAVFSGVLAPVGVLFTGLAAYAFFGSLFGSWPGFAAALALLLLPDGAQQGMQNPFMSYHWLTHISPSATYGLALLALAWLFVIQGSLHKSWKQVFCGWALAALLVAYKLHYVIASSLLLMMIPALFFSAQLGLRKRAFWVMAAIASYVGALYLGQMVPGVPLIRFDGSSIGEILHLISTFIPEGQLRSFVEEHMGRDISPLRNLLKGIPYVILAALGLVAPVYLMLAICLRKRLAALHILFPLLLLLNFLFMFFGLALDFSSSTPDELSHRPVMIVYFFTASWIGGATGLLVSQAKRLHRWTAPLMVGLSVLLLVVPFHFGPGVQLMWIMPRISPARVPTALVEIAEHIRTHSRPQDVFQDAEFDRFYAIAALSERRTFVAHTMTAMPYRSDLVIKRTEAVNNLLNLRYEKLVKTTAKFMKIRWFVRFQGARANWPEQMREKPAFQSGPFYLYDFEH